MRCDLENPTAICAKYNEIRNMFNELGERKQGKKLAPDRKYWVVGMKKSCIKRQQKIVFGKSIVLIVCQALF